MGIAQREEAHTAFLNVKCWTCIYLVFGGMTGSEPLD